MSTDPKIESKTGPSADDFPPRRATRLRQANRHKRLDRSTHFIIVAAVILGLSMSLVGNMVSTRVERAAVQSAAEAGALYMEVFLEPHVQELNEARELTAESIAALDRLTANPSLNRHIRSVKIWREDGTVLYGTDKTMIGKRFDTDDIDGAFKGRIVTELEELDQDENAFERTLDTPLYEIYVPLRDLRSGKILAVGEFYETADILEREISFVRQQVWIVVATATVIMLLLLFFVVRRGDRIIEQQQRALKQRVVEQARLHARNRTLQRRINIANHEFSRVNELTLRRIGADLHDGPLQLLTLVLLMLDDLAELQQEPDSVAAAKTYEMMRGAARDAMGEIRDISRGLVLPEIAELNLADELELVARRHEQRTGTKVAVELGPLPAEVPLPLKFCLYRFVQEGLNNAYHHAGGEGQRVCASHQGDLLLVEVIDTGPGIDRQAPHGDEGKRSRLGLASMRYRIEALGGQFHISSSAGQGTRLTAQFKL